MGTAKNYVFVCIDSHAWEGICPERPVFSGILSGLAMLALAVMSQRDTLLGGMSLTQPAQISSQNHENYVIIRIDSCVEGSKVTRDSGSRKSRRHWLPWSAPDAWDGCPGDSYAHRFVTEDGILPVRIPDSVCACRCMTVPDRGHRYAHCYDRSSDVASGLSGDARAICLGMDARSRWPFSRQWRMDDGQQLCIGLRRANEAHRHESDLCLCGSYTQLSVSDLPNPGAGADRPVLGTWVPLASI